MNEKLAKISKGRLEIKERGMLNFWISVDYEDGLSQGIGGIVLDEYNEEKKERIGTAYGCEMIRRVLLALDVNDFSEMAGKHIWVIGEGDGLSFTPRGLRQLNVDSRNKKPIIFQEIADEMINANLDKPPIK